MPVVTRSQNKFAVPQTQNNAELQLFLNHLKTLMVECQLFLGKENKMKVVLQILELVYSELPRRIAVEGLDMWIIFITCVYSKTTQFIAEMDHGIYFEIDKNILANFSRFVHKTRNFTSDIIKNYCGLRSCDIRFLRAKEEISSARRPLRNIPRVNYAGMAH